MHCQAGLCFLCDSCLGARYGDSSHCGSVFPCFVCCTFHYQVLYTSLSGVVSLFIRYCVSHYQVNFSLFFFFWGGGGGGGLNVFRHWADILGTNLVTLLTS